MPIILSAADAKSYATDQQMVEAKLAKALYDAFDQGTALFKLQLLAARCIKTMLKGAPLALLSACQIESKLSVWGKIGGNSRECLRTFLDRGPANSVGTFHADDVSDVIRLFGQWVEGNQDGSKGILADGGAAAPGLATPVVRDARGKLARVSETDAWGQKLTPSYAVKDAYRPGVMGSGSHTGVLDSSHKDSWKDEVEDVWGDQKGRFANVAVARRDRGEGWKVEDHVDLRQNRKEFAGIQGKRARKHSNVLKIDRMFGLLVGADISGTTADTVFALETIGADYLTAAYYMLPLATIVYKNHHSMLEVALALTLNGVIDYDIGFYESLMPDSVVTLPRELAGLGGILQQFDNVAQNRCFAVYYSEPAGKDPAGGFLFREDELGSVRGLFNAKNLLAKAPNLPDYPTAKSLSQYFGVS